MMLGSILFDAFARACGFLEALGPALGENFPFGEVDTASDRHWAALRSGD